MLYFDDSVQDNFLIFVPSSSPPTLTFKLCRYLLFSHYTYTPHLINLSNIFLSTCLKRKRTVTKNSTDGSITHVSNLKRYILCSFPPLYFYSGIPLDQLCMSQSLKNVFDIPVLYVAPEFVLLSKTIPRFLY